MANDKGLSVCGSHDLQVSFPDPDLPNLPLGRYSITSHTITDKDRNITFRKSFLKSYGCIDCSLKALGLCDNGLFELDEVIPAGYCSQLVNYLFEQAEPGDTQTMLKERYRLNLRERIANKDYASYVRASQDNKRLHRDPTSTKEQLAQSDLEVIQLRLWLDSCDISLTKGLSRINDRDQRNKEQKVAVTHRIELSQIHQLARDAQKESEIIDVPMEEKHSDDDSETADACDGPISKEDTDKGDSDGG